MPTDTEHTKAGVQVADSAKQKPTLLSYDPATLPTPVTSSDEYAKAQLVQLRVLTKSVAELTVAVKELTQALTAEQQRSLSEPTTEAAASAVSATAPKKRASSSRGSR